MSSTTPSLATQHVDIGPELGVLLDLARAADLPVLVTGRHGIGKSQYVAAWAEARGLRSSVLDLSLLEATDLTDLPLARDGRTHFAPPARLPTDDDAPGCSFSRSSTAATAVWYPLHEPRLT